MSQDMPLGLPPGLSDGVSIAWLLRDRFSTDRAAGAVDGTAAEPGPGTRTAIELSGATVSIDGSRAKLIGTGTLNDIGLGYDVTGIDVTRAVGKTMMVDIEYTGAAGATIYLSPQNAVSASARITTGSAAISYRDSAHVINIDGPLTPGQVYAVKFINRATGNFLIIDGKLLSVGRENSDDSSFVRMAAMIQSDRTLWIDNVRLVQLATTDPTLYPIPVLSDSFDRSNGAIGSTDGAGHLEGQTTPQGDGVAYSNAATWTISSNVATNTPSVAADYLCYAAGGKAEVYHTVKVTRTTGEAGIVLNAADTDNYLRVVHDGTNVITTEVVSGTPNVLSTVAATYAAGARLEARRIGNTVRAFYNEVYIAEVTPNAALQNNTAHGLYSDSSGNTFDDLETWPTTGYSYGEYA